MATPHLTDEQLARQIQEDLDRSLARVTEDAEVARQLSEQWQSEHGHHAAGVPDVSSDVGSYAQE